MEGNSAVDCRGDDEADSQGHCADHNGQCGVLLFDDFLPQLVWRHQVYHEERDAKDDHAEKCKDNCVDYETDIDHEFPLLRFICGGISRKCCDRRPGCYGSTSVRCLSRHMS